VDAQQMFALMTNLWETAQAGTSRGGGTMHLSQRPEVMGHPCTFLQQAAHESGFPPPAILSSLLAKPIMTDSSLLALHWQNHGKYLKHAARNAQACTSRLGRSQRFLSSFH
jgi:hypothetical protein